MQQVFKANDLRLKREVAIKIPKSASAERRFESTAILSARVNHPNVAKTLDYIEDANRGYLVEEFIGGTDLQKLKKSIPLYDPFLAGHILHHLARGIAASHHVNVVHRDLKPSNIMIGDDASFSPIKVTDFGIAKMAETELVEAVEGGVETMTGSQTLMGAIPYMSPEMIEEPRSSNKPADIWAIGAICYELISGRKPYGAGLKAVSEIRKASEVRRPDYLSKIQYQRMGDELMALIHQCMEKDPTKRPSADQLVIACGQLCYSDVRVRKGVVANLKGKTFGFIASAGPNVFFHQDSVYGPLPVPGSKVYFAEFPGVPQARAHPVVVTG